MPSGWRSHRSLHHLTSYLFPLVSSAFASLHLSHSTRIAAARTSHLYLLLAAPYCIVCVTPLSPPPSIHIRLSPCRRSQGPRWPSTTIRTRAGSSFMYVPGHPDCDAFRRPCTNTPLAGQSLRRNRIPARFAPPPFPPGAALSALGVRAVADSAARRTPRWHENYP